MNKCPKCSNILSDNDLRCDSCGLNLSQEFDQTIAQPKQDEEHTPTRIQNPQTQGQVFDTPSNTGEIVAGTILDERYRILGILGKGGMGEVYKAQDLKLDQTVALKFLPENLATNKEALKRFVGEVRTARQVSHENVCSVFDISDIEGRHFLSMEFVDGDDLSQLLRRIGRLPTDKAIEISRQICMGLNAIHKLGILHRDLKPANIIIDSSGKARITDFGIAGFEEDVQGAESRVGTPAYMSPEQRSGKEVTQKSDIYSLGLLLYEIFTGKQAVDSKTLDKQITSHNTKSLNKSTEFQEQLDPTVEKLIERCIEDDPDKRPDSAIRVALGLPGGDPLQVALEAGETPSPEMVAAAGKKGTLKPIVAFGLLLAAIISFGITMYWSSQYQIHSFTPLEKSPDVLRERSKTIIQKLGYQNPDADNADGFGMQAEYANSFFKEESKAPNERLRKGQPLLMYFWYRQSQKMIVPDDYFKIRENSPPFIEPGSIRLKLDALGRLVEMVAIPERIKPQTDKSETNWKLLFEAAGLDAGKFRETQSKLISPYFSDESKAWEGTLVDFEEIPIRVEAAGFHGKPVYFKIIMPWDKTLIDNNQITQARKQASNIGNLVGISVAILFILGAVFISYHNLKVGRVDIKGAAKISVFCFLMLFIGFCISADHVASVGNEFQILIIIASHAVFPSVILFLAYLAIEPFVRRWWSNLLISWNRLLSGDFRDPMIGRDILIGALLGILTNASFYIGGLLRDYLTSRQLTLANPTNTLGGFSNTIKHILVNSFAQQIVVGVGILLFLLMFYLVFRRKWVGTTVLILLITFLQSVNLFPVRGWTYVILQLLVATIVYSAYAKYGLVTIISSLFFASILNLEVTFDSSRFYFANTIIVAVVGLGIAFYAFYISLAGQSLFGRDFFENDRN